MKIVMTVTNPFKPDPRVYKEAKSLVNAGHEVIVLAWDREGKYPKEETVEGIKVVRFGPRSRYGNFLDFPLKLPLFYLKALLFLLRGDFDAIHTHDFDTALLGFVLKYLKGRKWVYDVHDLYYTFFEVEGKSTLFSRPLAEVIKRIDVFFAKWSDRLIVATQSIGGRHEGLREYYIRRGIGAEKITTIWNAPALAQFDAQKKLPKKSRGGFVIGFIGTIRTISNFIPLFEAVKTLDFPVRLLFVGGGKSLDELKKIVMEKYSELNVEFTGSVPYYRIQEYYRECNAIYSVYPYRENTRRAIAIKVFEATSLGIPVIVNSDTLMEDFVEEYRCGVATSLSLGDVKRALISISKIKFNPKYILKKWNWRRESEKLERIYKEER
ncbi:glycosyltransferase family 4 protein [Pyrococcus kukulkanii]|uniref:Glycosyltransferase n=1 Tax=Pyrococcus kukulkanii TaxID=1609559 RepID=A0A127B849_9EURY|nr:glycosyltransferase family 4 protein [Pyrococcus kukulkanii]AMM53541.1 hypothetical protein TQ32_02880 [Pyrococcus kukulkanii]